MKTIIKIFLASSEELVKDRDEFEKYINRKNNSLVKENIYLQLIRWEHFFDAVSEISKQNDYNQAIQDCDIFIMLFFTKVGKYTEEEFNVAYNQFKKNIEEKIGKKPLIYTYYKKALIDGNVSEKDKASVDKFKEKLQSIGHFYTKYGNIAELKLHFEQQLDNYKPFDFITPEPVPVPATWWQRYKKQLLAIGILLLLAATIFIIKQYQTSDLSYKLTFNLSKCLPGIGIESVNGQPYHQYGVQAKAGINQMNVKLSDGGSWDGEVEIKDTFQLLPLSCDSFAFPLIASNYVSCKLDSFILGGKNISVKDTIWLKKGNYKAKLIDVDKGVFETEFDFNGNGVPIGCESMLYPVKITIGDDCPSGTRLIDDRSYDNSNTIDAILPRGEHQLVIVRPGRSPKKYDFGIPAVESRFDLKCSGKNPPPPPPEYWVHILIKGCNSGESIKVNETPYNSNIIDVRLLKGDHKIVISKNGQLVKEEKIKVSSSKVSFIVQCPIPDKETQNPETTTPTDISTTPKNPIVEEDKTPPPPPPGMVHIKGIGDHKGFYIDETEVTLASFCNFLKLSGYTPNNSFDKNPVIGGEGNYSPVSGYGNNPVAYVSFEDAAAYAAFYSKSLPTESQWIFAFKSEPNQEGIQSRKIGHGKALNVREVDLGSLGIYGLVCNVREWVMGQEVIGGGWNDNKNMQHENCQRATNPGQGISNKIGFRCVKVY